MSPSLDVDALDVIWSARLDDHYLVKVSRDGERGRLLVVDSHDSSCLLDEAVTLSSGAPFGTDVADWQERALKAVDGPGPELRIS